MKIMLTLQPGDSGTKKLQLKYGGRLLECATATTRGGTCATRPSS
jgi:hypothetical protein